MSISDNLNDINHRIARASQKAGRSPSEIKLVCVTKNISAARMKEVFSLGITDIGESRIQEAEKKFEELSLGHIKKHFIGHLQTNKVKKAVRLFDLIQSVDSLHLAQQIDKQSRLINKVQDCLVEVKVSEEETKYGCPPEDLLRLLEDCQKLKNIRICGLMTMAPFFDDPEQCRPYFRRAKEIFDRIYSQLSSLSSPPFLSMGMSNDFEIAIEEGSNMVRIGTAIFRE